METRRDLFSGLGRGVRKTTWQWLPLVWTVVCVNLDIVSFESMELVITISSITIRFSIIYRMSPVKSNHGLKQDIFGKKYNRNTPKPSFICIWVCPLEIIVGSAACEQPHDNTTNNLLLTTVDILYCIDYWNYN